MTLILKLDLDMVKTYLHTKNEVSMWWGSKVIVWTDRNIYRHTDMTENITYPHTHVTPRDPVEWGPMNIFEQVSSDDHQMSLAVPCLMPGGGVGLPEVQDSCPGNGNGVGAYYHVSYLGGVWPCTVRSNASWVIVTWATLWTDWLTDRHVW